MIRIFALLTTLFGLIAFAFFIAAIWTTPHTALKGELAATGGILLVPMVIFAVTWAFLEDSK